MKSFKKHQALTSLGQARMAIVEFLAAGGELDKDEQAFIENHILLIQLAYCNWKYGPPNPSKEPDASQRAA